MCLIIGRFTMRDDLFRSPTATYTTRFYLRLDNPIPRKTYSSQARLPSCSRWRLEKKQISYPFNPTTLGHRPGAVQPGIFPVQTSTRKYSKKISSPPPPDSTLAVFSGLPTYQQHGRAWGRQMGSICRAQQRLSFLLLEHAKQ